MNRLEAAITDKGHTTYYDGSRRLRVTERICVQEFLYGLEYVVYPGCPESPHALVTKYHYNWSTAGDIWYDYWKNLERSTMRTTFQKPERISWNQGHGRIVVYGTDKVYVMNEDDLDGNYEHALAALGFVRDNNLFVPFMMREAFYDPALDHRCNSCGLAAPI